MRWLLAALCLSFAVICQAAVVVTVNGKPVNKYEVLKPKLAPLPETISTSVEKILVLKSARKLQLIQNGRAIKTYRISLGKQPKGHKLREGDKRTPEGIYWVDWRKISDKFNLAMHIDYPNVSDAATARRDGLNPGGMIMIHGTPALSAALAALTASAGAAAALRVDAACGASAWVSTPTTCSWLSPSMALTGPAGSSFACRRRMARKAATCATSR